MSEQTQGQTQIQTQTELQKLGDETWPYYQRFCGVIGQYYDELWRYCRKLTGNPWDGEDLLQDTVLKMFTSLSALSHREHPIHPRAYLFRVATNHWIDSCHRRRLPTEEWQDDRMAATGEDAAQSIELHGAFETLLEHLPPKQTAVIVLMDAFRFTARETAEVIGTTEGAVHAALFRARKTLRKLSAEEAAADRGGAQANRPHVPHAELIDRYVACFNAGDYQGIADLLAEHAVYSFVTQISKEYGKDRIMNESHRPHGRTDLRAVARELWGRTAVVVYQVSEDGRPAALHQVMTIDAEDGHIVGINGYYFCPLFMEEAAAQLGVPREAWQWAE